MRSDPAIAAAVLVQRPVKLWHLSPAHHLRSARHVPELVLESVLHCIILILNVQQLVHIALVLHLQSRAVLHPVTPEVDTVCVSCCCRPSSFVQAVRPKDQRAEAFKVS